MTTRGALITSRRRPTPFERSRRPKMCYRTECGKCGKPTWVRDTRRAVAHHDLHRAPRRPFGARPNHVFHTTFLSAHTRDSLTAFSRTEPTHRLAEACTSSRRSAAFPRRIAAPAREVRRLPARSINTRRCATRRALHSPSHRDSHKTRFSIHSQANDTSAPSSVARVGVHHAPNTQAPRLLGGRCRDSEARPQNPPSSGGGHGR